MSEAGQVLGSSTHPASIKKLRQFPRTQSGDEKCFKWNAGKQCAGDCGRSHVCVFCGQPHTGKWHKEQVKG